MDKIVDGLITDWELSERLDSAATGAAGFALYGVKQDDVFYLTLTSEDVAIGATTTIWLDTDLDTSTGYLIWGFAGGAEYNIEIAADGSVALYTGAAGETFVADLEYAYSDDGLVLEIAIPTSLLDTDPDTIRVFADVNNAVFIPNDYANIDLFVSEAPPDTPTVVFGDYTIDGDLSEWPADARLDSDATGTPGYEIAGAITDGGFVLAIMTEEVQIGANTTIWLDTDLDRSTGYQIWGWTGGVEYNINISADGSAALYSGAAGETFVADLDYVLSTDGLALEIALPADLIGDPEAIRIFADVNDTAFIPNDYANIDLILQPGTPDDPNPVEFGDYTLDGTLDEWASDTRRDDAATGVDGYALYGTASSGGFVFALSAEAVQIGANTTIWLDTDLDRGTGYQIWGFTGGVEYNVNIGADGSAALYSGAAGETFVADLDYAYSDDGQTLEFAIAGDLIGAPEAIRVFADVNDAVFIPNDYANVDLIVSQEPDPDPEPQNDPELRIAIVFSATTAANFYYETAYSQLFMAVQHQAMQSGIPFDLLNEEDLMDAEALAGYDAIVFPGFSHVQSSDLAAIEEALTIASQEYGVSLIAAGNFMTNDETGAAIEGDSYARMKSLLGVTLDGYGQTDGIDLYAADGVSDALDEYESGDFIGSYTNVSYLTFTDVTGEGEVLFTQLLEDPETGTSSQAAVIATETGAVNVHFATDAIIGNNNILGEVLDYVISDDTPPVSMTMTRGTSLFYARNDMDWSAEHYAVALEDPGIYDVMLDILEDWYDLYGFVGSYYINIGNAPPDFWTDWTVSAAYYEQLLALESEIGSHSWSHPYDTNILQPDSPELLALLDLVDPRNPDHVDIWELSPEDQAILLDSYRFQFELARYEIELQLGIDIAGVAVPGAPETIDTSYEIMQYYDYISGGYSGIGAGYLSAFGYLTPDTVGTEYFAPNMSFDFSLIGFQDLTPEEATAIWLEELAMITANSLAPIIEFPWHDYALTNFDSDDTYTVEMFEAVVAAAAALGTEFVTGEELAERIDTFYNSELTLSQDGDVITAIVNSDDAGSFALHIDDGLTIASVTNWYAYDEDQVFLPRNGGTFEINLGEVMADVTHISSLPMRAELIAVEGDGRNLEFQFNGAGLVEVSLASQGSFAIQILGADIATVDGDADGGIAMLDFADVQDHNGQIVYFEDAILNGSSADEFIFGGDDAEFFALAGGDDVMGGGGGADQFLFENNFGNDRITDFTSTQDTLMLAGLGFADAQEAYDSFEETDDGLLLDLGSGNSILLNDIDLTTFLASDISIL